MDPEEPASTPPPPSSSGPRITRLPAAQPYSPPQKALDFFTESSLAQAQTRARQSRKVLLVAVQGADETSRLLDSDWWALPAVQTAALTSTDDLLTLRLSWESPDATELAQTLPVVQLPTIYFLSPEGEPLSYFLGVPDMDEFKTQLHAALNSLEQERESIESEKKSDDENAEGVDEQATLPPPAVKKAAQSPRTSSPRAARSAMTLGSSKTSSMTNNTTDSAAASTATAQPGQRGSRTELTFRLTDGTSLKSSFDSQDTLLAAKRWLDGHRTDGHAPYYMQTAWPKQVFTSNHLVQSLVDLSLTPNGVILISPADEFHPATENRGSTRISEASLTSSTVPDDAPPDEGFLAGISSGLQWINPLNYLPFGGSSSSSATTTSSTSRSSGPRTTGGSSYSQQSTTIPSRARRLPAGRPRVATINSPSSSSTSKGGKGDDDGKDPNAPIPGPGGWFGEFAPNPKALAAIRSQGRAQAGQPGGDRRPPAASSARRLGGGGGSSGGGSRRPAFGARVHGLGSLSSSNDDDSTYNGNSTQQR